MDETIRSRDDANLAGDEDAEHRHNHGRRLRALTALTAAAVIVAAAASVALAQAPGPLSAARYAAIDSIKTAFIPVVDGGAGADGYPAVRRVCDTVDRSDRMLAIVRRDCLTGLQLFTATDSAQTCQSPRACGRVWGTIRGAMTQLIGSDRALNDVLAAEVPAGPCRTLLRTSRATLRSAQNVRNAARDIQRGYNANNRAIVRRASKRFASLSPESGHNSTATQRRDRFRRVCAPAQTPVPQPTPPGVRFSPQSSTQPGRSEPLHR